jgi:hypothetical protein
VTHGGEDGKRTRRKRRRWRRKRRRRRTGGRQLGRRGGKYVETKGATAWPLLHSLI